MIKGIDKQVSHNHMLSIFSGETIEQPYRFQPKVNLIVDFDEYKKFVQSMVNQGISWLSFGVTPYQDALNAGNDSTLIRYYYMDVSKAILNELTLAVNKNVECTIISHHFNEDKADVVDINRVFSLVSSCDDETRNKAFQTYKANVNPTQLIDPTRLSRHNRNMYWYAMLLRVKAYSDIVKFNVQF